MARNNSSGREYPGLGAGISEQMLEELAVAASRPLKEKRDERSLSIGRVAAVGSFRNLRDQATELEAVNPEVSITVRPNILCTYVDEGTLASIIRTSSDFQTPEEVLEFILASDKIDPEGSRLSMSPELLEVTARPKKKGKFKIIARIADEKADSYPSGYRLTGESLAINGLLGIDTEMPTVKTGNQFTTLPLATVAAPNLVVASEMAAQLAQSIILPIELGLIGLAGEQASES